MFKFTKWAVLGGLFALASAQAGIVLTSTPGALSADTFVLWSQLGPDQTVLGTTFTAAAPIAVNGTFANGANSIVAVTCPEVSCSWVTSGTGINTGDSVIWTSNNGVGGNAPLTLAFTAEFGAGLWLQSDTVGTYTAQIQAFHNATSLLTGTVTSDANGDPIFIGALDTVQEITSIQLVLTANSGGGNLDDFAVDKLGLVTIGQQAGPTPEPGSFWLLSAVLPLLGWRWRKRLGIGILSKAAVAKASFVAVIAGAVLVSAVAPTASAQVPVGPLQVLNDGAAAAALRASAPVNTSTNIISGPSLAVSPYSVVAYDGNTYVGEIVGRSPFARGARTTSVSVVVIPVIVKTLSGSNTFISDPTSADAGCLGAGNTALSLTQNGPILNPPPSPWVMNGVTVGGLTFNDAHLRAEFWSLVAPSGNNFHLALPFTTGPTQTLDATGQTTANANTFGYGGTHCGALTGLTNNRGALGALNINYLDPILQGYITSLGYTHDVFPFFVIYRTVITDGSTVTGPCCILGYHNSQIPQGTGDPGRTYGIALFDTGDAFGGVADTSVMAHEVGEWINDPGGNNLTPVYSSGQTATCGQGGQNNFEVGDPLSGLGTNHTVSMAGFTYHLQELTYFSWFFGADHVQSLGAGGAICSPLSGCFSTNGTFKGPAHSCPTGGTWPN